MKPLVLVFVFGLLMLAAATVLPATRAFADDTNIQQMVENAKTAADYEAIAAYYDKKADDAQKQLEWHEALYKTYKQNPRLSTMQMHCDRLVQIYRQQVKEEPGHGRPVSADGQEGAVARPVSAIKRQAVLILCLTLILSGGLPAVSSCSHHLCCLGHSCHSHCMPECPAFPSHHFMAGCCAPGSSCAWSGSRPVAPQESGAIELAVSFSALMRVGQPAVPSAYLEHGPPILPAQPTHLPLFVRLHTLLI
jgi:hypothetical protein